VTAKRPGRVQQIAFDATPLNAANVDLEARIGWLLAMSRLHHPDPQFQDGRVFATALSDAGVPTSRSLLSRWESGEIPISYEAMAAYEDVLGLAPGQISSITGFLGAILPGVKARLARPKLDPTTPAFAARFDELIDLAEDGHARSRDWQDLGWHLAAVPLAHLRSSTWAALSGRLVNELPRTVKLAYRQYSTAAFNLARVPRAQNYLVEAIAEYVADPDAQVLTSPVGLLDRLPTRAAASLVLDLVEQPANEATFKLGVWLAAQKLGHGHFTREERDRLDMLVLSLWRRNPARASDDLVELIAAMPEGMRATLVDAATKAGRRKLGYAVEHGEEIAASRARAFAQQVADHARGMVPQEAVYAEDRMLTRLVREALFHRDSERRHLAALLLASSPFGSAVAESLLIVCADRERSEWLRSRMATLVRYLSDETHRMRIMSLLDDPVPTVCSTMAQALGHMPQSPTTDQALRASLKKEWSLVERAKMYALGMSGSSALPAIARSRQAPEWQRNAARWWHEQGPAILP
jgi:transcriptional regulator with XRE-family HTH domain